MSRTYTNHFRLGGVKLTLDGSPQGKTGWFTQPYFKVPEGQKPDYKGYPALSDEKLSEWVMLAYENGWQVFAHCSGDAVATDGIDAKETSMPVVAARASAVDSAANT